MFLVLGTRSGIMFLPRTVGFFSFERAVTAAAEKLAERNCQGMGLYLTNAYSSQQSDAGTYYVMSAEAVRRANLHLDLISPNELSKQGLCTILPESLQRDLHAYLDEKEPPPPRRHRTHHCHRAARLRGPGRRAHFRP